ncbi:Glycogen synthase [Falsiruegeria litorea R37]|uniref:Glycogen synthase n=1 Tax=Falsiruegeria litorea R37 TaxID=1200284 RepID=A0A1Y5RW45_9RHOB|nr:glycosyltransferase family 4 protein [Falsiruegeria litorea]SLN26877.1 Glycogen synthase [Falsiruegeria litorea R37]
MDDSATDVALTACAPSEEAALTPTPTMSAETLVILNVCETAQGGVGRYQDALGALSAHGFSCHVLLPDSDLEILTDTSRAITFSRPKRGPVAILQLLRGFRAARRRVRPHIYFFHSTFALLPLLFLRLSRDKTPAVYCAHCWAANTSVSETLKKQIIRRIEGNLCGLADLVVNVSHSDAETARQNKYRGRHVVVENAVAPAAPDARFDLFPRPTSDTINLLFVGRFDQQKGLDILLDAFRRARINNPDLALHLVGEPVRSEGMPHLPAGVSHHGWIPSSQIDSFYRSADALVVPSRWEGLPLVIPEAYRNGTPVLAARTSGMEHLVQQDQTGHIFDLAPTDLGELLASLDRKHLVDMRPNALALYRDRFSLDRFSRELASHLLGLVSNGKARTSS